MIETLERVVDVPVIKQVEVPQVQTVEKVVEIPQVETVQGETRMVQLQGPTQRQNAPPEVIQVTEVGPDLPAEVMPGQVTMGQPSYVPPVQQNSYVPQMQQTQTIV